MPPEHWSKMKCGNELHAGDTSQSTRTCVNIVVARQKG